MMAYCLWNDYKMKGRSSTFFLSCEPPQLWKEELVRLFCATRVVNFRAIGVCSLKRGCGELGREERPLSYALGSPCLEEYRVRRRSENLTLYNLFLIPLL